MSFKPRDGMVYVFSGRYARYPNAVFSSLENGRKWIRAFGLTGSLSYHQLDTPIYARHVPDGTYGPRPLPPGFGGGVIAADEYFDSNASYHCKNGVLDDEPGYHAEVLMSWKKGAAGDGVATHEPGAWELPRGEEVRAFVVLNRWHDPIAVFSSLDAARPWIRAIALTGLVRWHDIDMPDFDRDLVAGTLLPRSPLRKHFIAGGSTKGYRELYFTSHAQYMCLNGTIEDDREFAIEHDRVHGGA